MNVVITGGGTGIGRAVAEAVVAAGGRCVIAGRRQGVLDEVVGASDGTSLLAVPCDVTDPAARRELWRRSREFLGRIDALVCSAGAVVHEAPGVISEEA